MHRGGKCCGSLSAGTPMNLWGKCTHRQVDRLQGFLVICRHEFWWPQKEASSCSTVWSEWTCRPATAEESQILIKVRWAPELVSNSVFNKQTSAAWLLQSTAVARRTLYVPWRQGPCCSKSTWCAARQVISEVRVHQDFHPVSLWKEVSHHMCWPQAPAASFQLTAIVTMRAWFLAEDGQSPAYARVDKGSHLESFCKQRPESIS